MHQDTEAAPHLSSRPMSASPSPPPRRRPARRAVLLAAAAASLSAAVSGCTFTNPQLTAQPYLPADGQVVDLGDGVVVSSLHVITRAQGEPGVLLARVTSGSPEPRQVAFVAENLDEAFTVPPNETLEIGGVEPGSALVVIDPVTEAPGLLLPMTVAVEDGTTEEVRVPVMDGTLEYYEPYLLPPQS